MQINKKTRKTKQKLSDKFKQQCQLKLKKQPPMYLMNSFKDKVFTLDIDLLQADDLPSLTILLKLPITKIHMYCQQSKKSSANSSPIYNSYKFKDVLKEISQALIKLQSLKSLIFQRVPLTVKHLLSLKQSIGSTQILKQLSFKFCQLTDEHLQAIKSSIAKNQSLVILDLSHNKFCNVGSMVGKIMSEHSSRRDELIWFASLRGQTLEDDLSKKGICEVNLQGNQLNDKSANQIVQFLKADQWSRCLNLKNNKLTVQGVKQFARLMKKNSTLISLDLRGNPGFNKQYSIYILKKLKQNIQKYREEKKGYQKYKKLGQQKTQQNIQSKNNHHKSLYQSRRQSLNKKTEGTALQFTMNNNNITSLHKSRKNIGSKQEINCDDQVCVKCRQKTLQILKLEKKNLDLQIEIKKLKRILLTKNIDLSAILPHQHHNSIQSLHNNEQFTRAIHLVNHSQNDEDLIGRVEQIMMQLTKIMDNIDAQQNTQINISNNNISNAHSLSNTIPLFARPSELQQLQLEESTIQIQDKGISTNIGKLTSQDEIN